MWALQVFCKHFRTAAEVYDAGIWDFRGEILNINIKVFIKGL